jgi:CelD/BcsL family acetyltransferase involved in cellulose biosynthesis
MLEISLVDSFEALAKLEVEWDALLDASPNKNIFLTFEWISTWWKYFGHGKRLFVLLAKNNGKLIGIAPLMISGASRFGISTSRLEFIGMPLSDYSDFIISEKSEQVLQAIYAYLDENRHEWGFINLNRILESSSTLDLSRGILNRSGLFGIYHSDFAPSLVFDGNDEIIQKKILDKSARKKLKIFLENKGGSIESCKENGGDAQELLHIFFEIHKKRWNSTSTPSIFNDPNTCQFFESVMLSLMKKGQADIFYLTVDKRPIAFLMAFLYDNVYLQYIIVHDTSLSQYYPGIILLVQSLEYNRFKKYREYDFMRGGEKYKFKYANRIKRLYKISIHRSLFLYLLDFISSKLEMYIKQHERLYSFFIRFEKKLRLF